MYVTMTAVVTVCALFGWLVAATLPTAEAAAATGWFGTVMRLCLFPARGVQPALLTIGLIVIVSLGHEHGWFRSCDRDDTDLLWMVSAVALVACLPSLLLLLSFVVAAVIGLAIVALLVAGGLAAMGD